MTVATLVVRNGNETMVAPVVMSSAVYVWRESSSNRRKYIPTFILVYK
jgi:hypothetical protein